MKTMHCENMPGLRREADGYFRDLPDGNLEQVATDAVGLVCEAYFGGFCGCADQYAALEYALYVLMRDTNERVNDCPNHEMFALYVLDQHGLTEHGGSVMWGWLTDKGRQFVEDVKELERRIQADEL